MILLGGVLVGLVTLAACTEPVDLNLKPTASQLVVEGYLFDKLPPPYTVMVTRSTETYVGENAFPGETGALVTIEDNHGQKDTLVEDSIPGAYRTRRLKAIPNRLYTLRVKTTRGEEAWASSYMPHAIELGGLVQSFVPEEQATSFFPSGYYVALYGKDPDTLGNNYRVTFYKNDTLFNKPTDYFVWDDQFINGQFIYQRTYYALKKGDKARIELWSMDKNALDYYYTLIRQLTAGGPFSPPGGNVSTNMRGALGYFGANAISVREMRIE
jgi:hypothetical protein